MSLLSILSDSSTPRSKAARKLARYVLDNPKSVTEMSIAALASAVSVSEPTVNRFCTGLGRKGFPDFKLALASELGRQQHRMAQDVEAEDSAVQVIAKIFESTQASLELVQSSLDGQMVEYAVDALEKARSILLFGLGASASVAQDAQHKLLRFSIPVSFHADIINQRVVAAGLTPEDCVVCISYRGRTRAVEEVAQIARASGATVIGITDPGSPLAQVCSLVLPVESGEDTELYTPMTSRIAQLVLIDVLATLLAIRQGPEFSEKLKSVKEVLAATRHPAA